MCDRHIRADRTQIRKIAANPDTCIRCHDTASLIGKMFHVKHKEKHARLGEIQTKEAYRLILTPQDTLLGMLMTILISESVSNRVERAGIPVLLMPARERTRESQKEVTF